MDEFRLGRPGDVDLVFTGELLADVSTHVAGAARWSEARIYRTDSGRYVAEVVGRSNVRKGDRVRLKGRLTTAMRDERDRVTITLADGAGELRDRVTRKPKDGGAPYIPDFILDALEAAVINDPTLATITEERI